MLLDAVNRVFDHISVDISHCLKVTLCETAKS